VAKKSAIDRAIDEMCAARDAARLKFAAEETAMTAAIGALMKQQRSKPVRKPRTGPPVEKAGA